jgi:preprotein translocase subunit SecE
MPKKAGAIKEKKGGKPGVEKVAAGKDSAPDSAGASQGKTRSRLRLGRGGTEPADKVNSPAKPKTETKPKTEKKVAAKGKDSKPAPRAQAVRPRTNRKPLKELGEFFKSTWAELKKVHWPTLRETAVYTAVVIASVIIVALLIWLADSVFSKLLSLILG